jgi:hypothetical protein
MPYKRPRGKRSEAHDHRLMLYSLAAAAAGVGVLALASPAEGSVVVTHTNLQISPGHAASIDLNKDGVNDFALSISRIGYVPDFFYSFAIKPLTGGKVMGGNRGPGGAYASAVLSGANIGSTAHFSSSIGRGQLTIERSVAAQTDVPSHFYYGVWRNVTDHYLGVKFLIKGATHYGWIRLTFVTPVGGLQTITEYAYETVANKSIAAGATTDSETVSTKASPRNNSATAGPSLGMLARGVDGLPFWRNSLPSETRATIEH